MLTQNPHQHASLDEHAGCGSGFIARNDAREFAFAAAQKTKPCLDPEVVEAEAVVWALEVCSEKGVRRVCFESDCLTLISKIKSQAQSRGAIGNLLKRILLLSTSFTDCRWSHVRRPGNRAADFLLKIRHFSPLFVISAS